MQSFLLLGMNLALSKISRYIDRPLNKPVAVFYSLTNECHSKCNSCNIWKIKSDMPALIKSELTSEEWKHSIQSIGNSPYWVSITGGEPILRKDLSLLIKYIIEFNRPKYISIATSGIYPEKTKSIVKSAALIAAKYGTRLFVNVSVDDIDEGYKKIRGVDAFGRVKKTILLLKGIKERQQFVLGINMVLSDNNSDKFKSLYADISSLFSPDSFICEIIGSKKSLGYINESLDKSKAIESINYLLSKKNQRTKSASIISGFRKRYYGLVKKHLIFNREIVKCHAGYAFCFISPMGEVKFCSVRGENLGSLRNFNFDFKRLWNSPDINELRKIVKKERCFCNDSGASYINLLIG